MNLETDAPEPDYSECIYGGDGPPPDTGWTKCLIEVDGGLDENDVHQLKFLLRGFITDARLKNINRGTTLFQDLENSGYIDIDNGRLELLEECLYRVHRKDLIRKLGGKDPLLVKQRLDRNKQEVRAQTDPGDTSPAVTPFRVMLYEIGEDIDDSEFGSALFTLGSLVPKGQLKKMESIFDLFLYLEKKDELSVENVDILTKVLKAIDRGDLIDKVLQYKNNYMNNKTANKPVKLSVNLPRPHPPPAFQQPPLQHRVIPTGFHGNGEGTGGFHGDEELMETEPRTPLTAGTESVSSQENMDFVPNNTRATPISRQLSQGVFFNLSPEIAKLKNWQQLVKDLGITERELKTIQQKTSTPASHVLNALQQWHNRNKDGRQDCNKLLADVLRKYNLHRLLRYIGISSESEIQREPELTPVEPFQNSAQPAGPLLPPSQHPVQPHPSVLPPAQPHPSALPRMVMEMQTQTSMYPETALVREEDQLPNRAVSNAEAQVSIQPLPQQSENLTVQSTRNIQSQMIEDILSERLRDTAIDDLELPSYKMNAKPRGIAVILNNMNFFKVPQDRESKEMPPRTGTDRDADNLVYIFRKLDFIIERHDDLQDFQMVQKLVEVAYNHDHSQYDCLVVCILSHGVLGNVYGTNGRLVEIKECTGCFKAQRCPGLAGKPKLFFIQACQGREKQGGHEIEADSDLEYDNGPAREMIPDEADFVLGYATVPGYVSYRSRTQGSWYVNKLVQMLEKYSQRYDLLSILVKVNEEVGRANAHLEGGHYKQIPAPLVTLRKKLYFR